MTSNTDDRMRRIKETIGAFPDFPKPGVVFRDIFPLFCDPALLNDLVTLLAEQISDKAKKMGCHVDAIIGLDSRGFLFGPMISQKLGNAFVPVRKKGKLPGECVKMSYNLEYGEDTVEMQKDSLKPGQNVVIVDDLLATGGTMKGAADLVKLLGANIIECVVVIELNDLKGRDKVPHELFSLVSY